MSRKEWGSGSLFQRKDGIWVRQVYIDGKPRQFYGRTAEEAERRYVKGPKPKPSFQGPILPAHPILFPRDRSGDKALAAARRATALRAVRDILIAGIEDWTLDDLTEAIVAQLAPGRIRRGVTGPCAYCGTWRANTVDHVIPKAKGGLDEPANLVSACLSCNSAKWKRTPEEWQVSA